jgi:hypothetical protein
VVFYHQRGKAEQYIKEGKNAIRWLVRHIPIGRGCCAEGTVRENPEPD